MQVSRLVHQIARALDAGIETSLAGMAAEQWEVRNAASLTFATLVLRTVGVRNSVKVRGAQATCQDMCRSYICKCCVSGCWGIVRRVSCPSCNELRGWLSA